MVDCVYTSLWQKTVMETVLVVLLNACTVMILMYRNDPKFLDRYA